VTRTATPAAGATATATATQGAGATATPGATPTPGGNSAQVAQVTSELVPFFVIGAGLTVGVPASALTAGTTTGVAADSTDNCPDGGTRTEADAGFPPTRTITLAGCKVSNQLGAFQFDGTIVIAFSGTITFDFDTTDLGDDHVVMFNGSLTGTPQSGGFVLDGGPITITTPQGNFTLNLDNIVVDSNKHLVSGSGTASDDSDNFDLTSVQLTVNSGGATANVHAVFDDASTADFVLDLQTGELTPA
jgi:hypothetical protein